MAARYGRRTLRARGLLIIATLAVAGGSAASATATAGRGLAQPRPAVDLTPARQCVKDGYPIPTVGPPPAEARRRAAKINPVGGYAFLDEDTPLVGAKIRLVDARGRTIKLRRARPRTSKTGAFLVATRKRPKRGEVVVSGGRVDGQRFRGTLRAGFAPYSKASLRYVNVATTLVSAYQRAYPRARLATVRKKVKRTLGIPQSANLTTDLLLMDHYFDAEKFLRFARNHGGFARATRRLVDAVYHGRVVRFPGKELPSGWAGDLAEWGGKQLASGAVSYVGGLAMGWVLGQIGIQSAAQTQLDQIQEALKEINSELKEIHRELAGLNEKADKQMLATLVVSLRAAESAVTGHSVLIKHIADMAADPTTPKTDLESQACAELASIYPLAGGTLDYGFVPDLVNKAFFPEPGVVSLTQAFITVIRTQGRWFTPRTSEQIAQMVLYWVALEQTWLQIEMEWQHAVHPCTAAVPTPTNCLALYWAGRYVSDTLAQQNTLPLAVPATESIDLNNGQAWVTGDTVASKLVYRPPNGYFQTFGSPTGDWIGNRSALAACASADPTYNDTSLCIAVRSSTPPLSGLAVWFPSTYNDLVGLISGFREAGFDSPLDYLTFRPDEPAAPPTGPEMSKAWLDQGADLLWLYPCYFQCETFDLTTGRAEASKPAGFLLTTRGAQPEPRYFAYGGSSHWQNGQSFVRYVSMDGSDKMATGAANQCGDYTTPCKTLEHAIAVAGSSDTIELGPGTFPGPPPVVKEKLTISGAGAAYTRIVGTGSTPAITMGVPTSSPVELALDDLTVSGASGPAIDVELRGTLTLTDGAIRGSGGPGILNGGKVTLQRSLVAANRDHGIRAEGASTATTVVNSTISGNSYSGVSNTGGSRLVLVNATLGGNGIAALAHSGTTPSTITITNSVLAGNDVGGYGVGDCVGSEPITAGPGGHNLIGKLGSCTFSAAGSSGNQVGTNEHPIDAKLGPLQLNGGQTNTMELKTGSPAIGNGDVATCVADPVGGIDQRGYTRPSGSCDIGAYDSKAQNVPPTG